MAKIAYTNKVTASTIAAAEINKITAANMNEIKTSVNVNVDDIAAEITNRANADTTLQNNIDAEETSRENADNLKANKANPTFTGTVSGITKAMVGLGNVDNTADVNKPVSTPQAVAIATAKTEVVTTMNSTAQKDAIPTNASTKTVTSGGVLNALNLKATLQIGNQKFNKLNITPNTFTNIAGVAATNNIYVSTIKIPVKQSFDYKGNISCRYITFYDSLGAPLNLGSEYATSFQTAATTFYVILTLNTSNYLTFMLNEGTVSLPLEEYKETILPSNLLKTIGKEEIKDSGIETIAVKDKNITLSKLSDEVVGKLSKASSISNLSESVLNDNVYNKLATDNEVGRYLIANGSTTAGSYFTTGLIDLTKMTVTDKIYFTNNNFDVLLRFYVFLDGAGVVLAGGYLQYGSGINGISKLAGASYLRASVASNVNLTLMVNFGLSPKTYTEYGSKLPESSIKKSLENSIAIPSKLYMLSGTQNNIYVDAITKRYNPYKYAVRFGGSQGLQRRLERVASVSVPYQNRFLDLNLYELETFKVLKTLYTYIQEGISGAGTDNISISIVGDSYTDGMFYRDALLTNPNVPNLTMIGLRKGIATTNNYNEGRGGWTLANYFEIRTSSEGMNPFMHPDGKKYYGATGFWKDVYKVINNLSPSFSYSNRGYDVYQPLFNNTTGFLNSPTTGDVMYDTANTTFIEWNGSAWVNKLQSDYTWNFNYSTYLSTWGLTAPDILFEMLGVNDFSGADPMNVNFETWNTQINTFKTSYLLAKPSGKFVVIIPCSTFGGNNSSNFFVQKANSSLWELRNNIIEQFDKREGENIFVLDGGISIDSEFGYNIEDNVNIIKPFETYTGTDVLRVQEDLPHPYNSYPELGKCLAAFIQNKR